MNPGFFSNGRVWKVNNPEVQKNGRSWKFKFSKLLLTLVGNCQYTMLERRLSV